MKEVRAFKGVGPDDPAREPERVPEQWWAYLHEESLSGTKWMGRTNEHSALTQVETGPYAPGLPTDVLHWDPG